MVTWSMMTAKKQFQVNITYKDLHQLHSVSHCYVVKTNCSEKKKKKTPHSTDLHCCVMRLQCKGLLPMGGL